MKADGLPDAAVMQAAMERCARSADYEEAARSHGERKPQFKGK